MNDASEAVPSAGINADHAGSPPRLGVIWRQQRLAKAIRAILDGIDWIGRLVVVAALISELSVVITDLTI